MNQWLSLRVPPLLLLALFLAGQAVFAPTSRAHGIWLFLSFLFALSSAAIALAAVGSFWRGQTTVDPRQPQRSSALLTHGVYRWTRNPMYLAFAGVLLAQTLYLASPFGLLWVAAFVAYLTQWQIKPEEAALSERFGADYAAYRRRVRRWC